MAEIVLGVGTSHSSMLSTPPELWREMGVEDSMLHHFVDPETGEPIAFETLLERRKAAGEASIPDDEAFRQKWERCQQALAILSDKIRSVAPDVLVIVSADQREIHFDDNMPMFQVYWGDTVPLTPRHIPSDASEVVRSFSWGYGDKEMDVPVDTELARFMIDHLVENEFDISHSRYLREDLLYGGTIGPAGYLPKNVIPPKRQGLGHGWGFIIKRLLHDRPIPIVPILQQSTFPPNMPTPRRCYKFGQALAAAIEAWPSDKRVCVIASGGLSHFVTDEKIDNIVLQAITEGDGETLCTLPRERLNSAAAEIRSWITVAAACDKLQADVVDYVPVYRSEAGTGGGWAFVLWT